VGAFDIQGSRRFSTEELMTFYPFGPIGPNGTPSGKPRPFSRSEWNEATEKVQNLYANNGYIYAQVQPEEFRRTTSVGSPLIDLRWTIREGSPATINKVEIVGNDVTHERVIREAIVMLPGDLFSRHLTCAPRQTASTSTSSSESRSAGRATSTSGPHWGRALVWAGFLGWKSPTSSGEASGASCSGSSGRTSMTLP
jgi:hypothetical protein